MGTPYQHTGMNTNAMNGRRLAYPSYHAAGATNSLVTLTFHHEFLVFFVLVCFVGEVGALSLLSKQLSIAVLLPGNY